MTRPPEAPAAASTNPAIAAPFPGPGPGAAHDAAIGAELRAALTAQGSAYVPRTRHVDAAGRPHFVNRLIRENSPYLLQHAHNPVDWYPWGDEAFAAAERLGRPVFLSIGYSTCHWCHVMEEESFEDEGIARLLNERFVAIKVDREERPDVDAIYMSAVQALTGSGGWPMSVFLTSAREPFFGGTYFPPHDGARGARMGFSTLLTQLAQTFAGDRERVQRASASLIEAIKDRIEGGVAASPAAGTVAIDRGPIDVATATYRRLFDDAHGGMRRAPKFPSNIPVRLLLRAFLRHDDAGSDADLLHMCTLTLEKMAAGGMYDQIGGGFHRYSTDAVWLVPHFEKMLYDNALLVPAYCEAFQVTGRVDFARVAAETLEYLMREMTAPGGGFFSATDADSRGDDGRSEEGRFFVWSLDEVRARLGDDADRFCRHYDITAAGNFEGHNIPHVTRPDEAEHAALAPARRTLYEARLRRPPPLRDDKILAAWNGLAISAMAIGGRVLGQSKYVEAARAAAGFVLGNMKRGDRIVRAWKDGHAKPVGFLDDQAFVVQGLLDLWESTFDERWLTAALDIAGAQESAFADRSGGGWFMTAQDGETLIAREKPQYDGAEPSGTSVAWRNALRLATLTDDPAWRAVAAAAHASVAPVLRDNPLALSEGLLALDWMTDEPCEIVIVVPRDSDPAAAAPLLRQIDRAFVASRVVIVAREGAGPAALQPLLRDRIAIDGRPTVYLCVHGRCDLPITDPAALASKLAPASRSPITVPSPDGM